MESETRMIENERKTGSLDELLNSAGQLQMREAVRALPEDVPSLAWRSQLGARLMEQAKASRSRRRLWFVLSPSLGGLAAACLFVGIFVTRHQMPPVPVTPPQVAQSQAGPSLEDQLVASHVDSDTSQDVVGSGLNSQEVQSTSDSVDSESQPSS